MEPKLACFLCPVPNAHQPSLSHTSVPYLTLFVLLHWQVVNPNKKKLLSACSGLLQKGGAGNNTSCDPTKVGAGLFCSAHEAQGVGQVPPPTKPHHGHTYEPGFNVLHVQINISKSSIFGRRALHEPGPVLLRTLQALAVLNDTLP